MTRQAMADSLYQSGELDARDLALISIIQRGLPLCPRPYAELGARIGMGETEVMQRLQRMQEQDYIKRMGVVVRHHELGYRANAMVVWDVPDIQVNELGHCLGRFEFITLCYQRPRRLPDWPYNLFCMIHGQDRDEVLRYIDFVVERCALHEVRHEVLFSKRRFKQRGAHYHRVAALTRQAEQSN